MYFVTLYTCCLSASYIFLFKHLVTKTVRKFCEFRCGTVIKQHSLIFLRNATQYAKHRRERHVKYASLRRCGVVDRELGIIHVYFGNLVWCVIILSYDINIKIKN